MQKNRVQKVKIWPSYELLCYNTVFSKIYKTKFNSSKKPQLFYLGPSSFGFYLQVSGNQYAVQSRVKYPTQLCSGPKTEISCFHQLLPFGYAEQNETGL